MSTTVSNGIVVNQAAVRQSVDDLKTTVGELRKAATNINAWGSGVEAGRAYADRGQKIATGFDRISGWLNRWTTATDYTAGAIGTATIELVGVDNSNAQDQKKIAAQAAGQ
ncbi:hypothetical protein ATM97_11880 [Nocardia sp. MH4]|jgi:hypothetical protein|uniref:hypothetical protein n=1 Tax=unclassified Nocardia TaxID=2637762 RepID=UPI001C4EAD64|nr:hypothetical protein [Nocardia sp. MH4]MBW0271452.1 hypothetical protein [Nocardia sp. MH4]